jgi:YQGE family putative transporter
MYRKFASEYGFFRSQPHNMQVLLATNMLYAIILPIIEIFVGAYIMRNTGSSSYVAAYQLCMYAGVVLTSAINGALLGRFRSSRLYAFGILISAAVLAGMMFMNTDKVWGLLLTGFVLGASTGFFWTNRYLLTLNATTDSNRNYFFGLESFFFSFWNIAVPLAAGAFLSAIAGASLFGQILETNSGYRIITLATLFIALAAVWTLSKGRFENPAQKGVFYFRYHSLWNKLLGLAGLKGMVQGFLVTAPAILVMKFVGNEGSLGLIQGIAGGITAMLVYVLGRISKPRHRMAIFGAGLFVFFAGTLLNGLLFSAAGVILFMLCKVFFQPLHDLAYYPVMMRAIDVVSAIEKRNGYAYILSHEMGLFAGRALGMLLFITLATFISEDFALKYALIIVAAIQLLSLPLAKHITDKCKS